MNMSGMHGPTPGGLNENPLHHPMAPEGGMPAMADGLTAQALGMAYGDLQAMETIPEPYDYFENGLHPKTGNSQKQLQALQQQASRASHPLPLSYHVPGGGAPDIFQGLDVGDLLAPVIMPPTRQNGRHGSRSPPRLDFDSLNTPPPQEGWTQVAFQMQGMLSLMAESMFQGVFSTQYS